MISGSCTDGREKADTEDNWNSKETIGAAQAGNTNRGRGSGDEFGEKSKSSSKITLGNGQGNDTNIRWGTACLVGLHLILIMEVDSLREVIMWLKVILFDFLS